MKCLQNMSHVDLILKENSILAVNYGQDMRFQRYLQQVLNQLNELNPLMVFLINI
jgi:hypothetical protein